ncbi:MAG: hypothetical protein M1324_01025 [Patescibacteria group bacterium]|nr:hypothetical protein [Patescibacteria group bacterium]
MSKKKNKKFKKNKPNKGFQKSETTNTFVSSDPVVSDESIINNQTSTQGDKSSPIEIDDPYSHNQYDHVKKDVRKIIALIGLIILVFSGIYILGLKTNILSSFGDWVYKIANIQTQ